MVYNLGRPMHNNVFLILLALSTAVLLALALFEIARRKTEIAALFGLAMFASAFWALTYALELVNTELAVKVVWMRLRSVPITLTSVLWFALAFRYSGRGDWLTPGRMGVILIVPAAFLLLSYLPGTRDLFLFDPRLDPSGASAAVIYSGGPLHIVHSVYLYGLLAAAFFLILGSSRGRQKLFKRHAFIAGIAIALPGLSNALFQLGFLRWLGANPTPVIIAGSAVLTAAAIFRHRFLDVTPVAGSLVMQAIPDLLLVLDGNNRINDFNPRACMTIGFDPAEAVGQPMEFLPDQWSSALADFSRSSASNARIDVETAAGRRTFEVSASPIKDLMNRRRGKILLIHDITDRVLAEEELAIGQERLRLAFDNSSDGLWDWDVSMGWVYWSPRYYLMLGYQPGEIEAGFETFKGLLHPEDRDKIIEHIEEFIRSSAESNALEFRIRKKDGGWIWVLSRGRVVKRGERGETVRIIGTQVDITEAKHAETALQKSREQLLHAQKMEAVGRLAGGIAHDFNNLLTVISGYCDLVDEKLPEKSPLKEEIGEIVKAAHRAASLTSQLLAFSRKQVLQPRVIEINELLLNMGKMIQRLIGEDVELETRLSSETGRLKADPGQIEQVILNLAVNARDAMPGGGRLTIESSSVFLDDPFCRDHPEMKPGRFIKISVTDTGRGMDRETLSRIFDPFFTTKEIGKGTGLGLPTAYGIITQSGGHILCASEPGKGMTFTLYFPSTSEETIGESKRENGKTAANGTETILLVEDEEAVRGFTATILRNAGYTVIEAPGGAEGLSEIKSRRCGLHLLLTDVVMPHMSGRELAGRLAEICGEAKVLYVSGYTGDAIAQHGVLEEGIDLIQKPFDARTLLTKIREILDRKNGTPERLKPS